MNDEEQQKFYTAILKKKANGDPLKDWIIPLGSLIVALLAVLSGIYAQYLSSTTTLVAATIQSKQVGYAKVVTDIDAALYAKQQNQLSNVHLSKIKQSYYEIELLIPKDKRERLLIAIEEDILYLSNQKIVNDEYITAFASKTRYLRHLLQEAFETDNL